MVRFISLFIFIVTISVQAFSQQVFAAKIPGYTGYAIPGQDGVAFDELLGCTDWTNPEITVQYHMRIQNYGQVGIRLMLSNDGPEPATISIRFSDEIREITVPSTGDRMKFGLVDAGLFDVPFPGFYTVRIKALTKTGNYFPGIMNVQVYSTFSDEISFQSTPDRHASTVNLTYLKPDKEMVGMCVNTIVPERYDNQGMKVIAIGNETLRVGVANEKIGRYLYFSWKKENDHPTPVFAGSQFKNFIVDTLNTNRYKVIVPYNWESGKPLALSLVKLVDTCTKSEYWEASVYNDKKEKWYTIGKISAGENSIFAREWYSAISNTDANSGYVERKAIFTDQTAIFKDGSKEPILSARFCHDNRGKFERKDYGAGADNFGFWLSTGGYAENKAQYGDVYKRKSKLPSAFTAVNLLVAAY